MTQSHPMNGITPTLIAEQQQKIEQQQLLIEDLLMRIEAIEAKH